MGLQGSRSLVNTLIRVKMPVCIIVRDTIRCNDQSFRSPTLNTHEKICMQRHTMR
jgi:hypothetical protein